MEGSGRGALYHTASNVPEIFIQRKEDKKRTKAEYPPHGTSKLIQITYYYVIACICKVRIYPYGAITFFKRLPWKIAHRIFRPSAKLPPFYKSGILVVKTTSAKAPFSLLWQVTHLILDALI
jgi:hypothetical protein